MGEDLDPDVESAFPEGIQRLSQIVSCVRRFGGDCVGGVGTEVVVVVEPGGVEGPDEEVWKPNLEGFGDALDSVTRKEGKEKEEANAFDAEKIFGGEDAADLKKQGDDCVCYHFCAQGFEGEAKGE